MRRSPDTPLYPLIQPYSSGYLNVDATHQLYWEQCGNPDGVPIIVLHGGPGAGCTTTHRRFFDPAHYRIILLDQRGAGRSSPLGCIVDNTLPHLVSDIEALRVHLRVKKWHLFGGSWGSSLALAYAQAYPQTCMGLIVYGIFLCTAQEITWFTDTVKSVYPDIHRTLCAPLNDREMDEGLIDTYFQRLQSPDPALRRTAGLAWYMYEASLSSFQTQIPRAPAPGEYAQIAAQALITLHYFRQFRSAPIDLLGGIDQLRSIPAAIIHSRYDMVCPISSADLLHNAWPEADYIVVQDAGHAALDPPLRTRLLATTQNARNWS
ncbi:MAG: prolyl aminopeptidase [Pseudomonadota bacterium]